MWIYLFILSVVLLGYLFLVAFQAEGYEPQLYEKGYLYFLIFQFVLFSLILPFWEEEELCGQSLWQEILWCNVRRLFQISLFAAASIPLIMLIFMAGHLKHFNFFLPLLVQVLWGSVILGIRRLLVVLNSRTWKNFILVLVNFTVLVLTLVCCYFYIEYGNLVITTIYDRDLPMVFFINPLLTTAGLLLVQIGGSTQMGLLPVIYHVVFYCLVLAVIWLVTALKYKQKYR